MKKKFVSTVLAGVMACVTFASTVFALGCGGKAIPDFVMPEGGFDITNNVEIKFYHTMGADLRKVLTDYIDEFNTLYPNITIIEDQIGKYDDVRDQIQTELNTGNQPNLAYCYPDHVALFNQANAVLPLNDFLPDGTYKDMTVTNAKNETVSLGLTKAEKDSFIPGYYEEGYQFDDGKKMYTLPFSKSTEVLYYNVDFFKKNDLTVPTTWAEMEQVCKRIKEIDPACTPLGYDSESNWFITMCEQYGSPYTSSSGKKFRFDNAKNREFVTMFKGWFEKGYFTTQEINKSYTSNLFKTQKSYMCIGSSAGAKNQAPATVDGKFPFEVGITSVPQVNPDKPKVISQGPSVCIFKNEDPQKVLASWLFVKFLTTSIGFQARFSSVSGYVPVITTVTQNETYKTNLEKADGYNNVTYLSAKVCMDQAKAYYTSPAFVGSSKARDEVGYLMQAVLTGSKTVDQAFKDAVEECVYHFGA